MIELDLGEELQIEVKYKGQTYLLREPTVSEIDQFRDLDPKSSNELVRKFLNQLGMPAEVVDGMGLSVVRKLIDGLLTNLTKKN